MVFRKATDQHGDWLFTDTHRWPIMRWSSEDWGSGDLVHFTRQALLRVESGFDVSVIWGSCTYSDNYHHPHGWAGSGPQEFVEEPALVEIALTQPDHRGVIGGDVAGWVTEEKFASFMVKVGVLPRDWCGDINELVEDGLAESNVSETYESKEQPT